MNNITEFAKGHCRKLLIAAIFCVATPIALIVICYSIINPYEQYILATDTDKTAPVGLVLGAGINKQGKPYDELKARLDSAAIALDKGTVDTLILSGDNRYREYNEPDAMKKYLIESRGVSADKLQTDYAGRSTYESCERTIKIFGVRQTIIFSAESHLSRAIYLCRSFGIEAYGVPSGLEANNSGRREPLARVKAVYNVMIRGEPTVLGDPIQLQ